MGFSRLDSQDKKFIWTMALILSIIAVVAICVLVPWGTLCSYFVGPIGQMPAWIFLIAVAVIVLFLG